MIALEMKKVFKARGCGVHSSSVLKGISLSVHQGDIILLEGASGSGKTTLLSVAAGLLLPDTGQVEITGISTVKLSPSERRNLRLKRIGFIFQQANLLSGLTVHQNVVIMATLAGMSAKKAAEETERLFHLLGLDKLVHRYPYELSRGEEQRVAVARALIHKPQIVLADEPTGNLDRAAGHAVAEALTSVAHVQDISVIIATHDYRLESLATRLISIEDGQIHERESE